jgi:hypothetical protein
MIVDCSLFDTIAAMATPIMRETHFLEGAHNFIPWKLRLQNLLEMADIWYLGKKVVTLPIDPKDLAEHNKKAVSECEANPIGFNEGSPNPSYHRERDHQRDV